MNQKHSVSVAAIVIGKEGRILCIQRQDNLHWEPPGGVLELQETFEEGLRREVLEETGLEVEIECLSGVYKNMEQHVVALVFRCKHVGGVEATSSETRRVKWLSFEEAYSLMHPAYAIRLADAVSGVVGYRVHDGRDLIN